MSKSWRTRSTILILLFVMAVMFFRHEVVWKWMYPIHYSEAIMDNAERYHIDPYLLLAIIVTESGFQPDKTSPKGAVGLMQIMQDTADWILQKNSFPRAYATTLYDPTVNIALGSWYLRYLHDAYEDDLPIILAAYNAGPGNVNRWRAASLWDGRMATLQHIPYGETRHYIQRVLYTYERYKNVYATGDNNE